jgi:hypothetical protein
VRNWGLGLAWTVWAAWNRVGSSAHARV